MTEPSRLPPRRELPPPTAERIRERVLAGTSGPTPVPGARRWLPLATAAAVVALVVATVAVARNPRADSPPAAPPPTASPAAAASPTPPPPPPPATPPTTADRRRCEVADTDRYVTGYSDQEAVTWLFIRPANKLSFVCTVLPGSSGPAAMTINDWYSDGMAPAIDGQLHATFDDMAPHLEDGATLPPDLARLERDRSVLVGTVPAEVRKVVVVGPDGQERQTALASSWFLYHYRGERPTKIYGYDRDGRVVASG